MATTIDAARPAARRLLWALFLAVPALALHGAELPLKAMAPVQVAALEDLHPLPGQPQRWLLATAYGLTLQDGERSVLLRSGHFAGLDLRAGVRIDGAERTLLSAVDVDAGTVLLFALRDAAPRPSLDLLLQIETGRELPQVQCLQREPASGNLALFIGNSRGMLEQRYVYDGRRQVPVDIPLRRFVGVPGMEACVVDDRRGLLYVAEEPLALWRYAAAAESDPERVPLLLREPHGALAGEVTDLALDAAGAPWVLDGDSATLHYLGADGARRYDLPQAGEPARLALAPGDGAATLALYDAARQRLLQAPVALPAVAPAAPRQPPALVARAETTPVRRHGDAADDPAIFVDARDPADSLILGTDKRAGLAVYGLDGTQRQFLPLGRLNNVDLLSAVEIGGERLHLAAASNRSNDTISFFRIADGQVSHLQNLPTGLREVYGLCMYRGADGAAYVFINAKSGRYEQYRIDGEGGRLRGELVRRFALPSQPEGCAADPVTRRLYLGEEGGGIWQAGAEPDGAAPALRIPLSARLVADVEGMDVYRDSERAYLVVSSQGSDSFVVYGLWGDYPLLADFRVRADLQSGIDGVSETDGLALTAAALPGYPQGLLVLQDGRNRMPDAPQNFKLVDWRDVAALLDRGTP